MKPIADFFRVAVQITIFTSIIWICVFGLVNLVEIMELTP